MGGGRTVGGVSVAGFLPGCKEFSNQERKGEGGPRTLGRGGTTHSLCVTTPGLRLSPSQVTAGCGCCGSSAGDARGASSIGQGLPTPGDDDVGAGEAIAAGLFECYWMSLDRLVTGSSDMACSHAHQHYKRPYTRRGETHLSGKKRNHLMP